MANSNNYTFSPDYFGLSSKKILPVLMATLLYVIWLISFVGMRVDHVYFITFFWGMYLIHPISRKLILSVVFFLLFWIIYDSMRVYPNYLFNDVHIIQPYEIEKSLFGFLCIDELLIPNEFFHRFPHPTFDLISGIFYLTWVPLPVLYGIFLFQKDRPMLLKFSFTFLLANLFGFVVYYMYPAAPPWYYIAYGNVENFNIPGNAANLTRFDNMIGSPIFQNMYNKNANVFAAIPSLHAAYPIILFYFGLKKRYKIASIIFFLDILGIWFAAVYSLHHYIIDLILGGICAIFAIFAFGIIEKSDIFQRFLHRYLKFSE